MFKPATKRTRSRDPPKCQRSRQSVALSMLGLLRILLDAKTQAKWRISLVELECGYNVHVSCSRERWRVKDWDRRGSRGWWCGPWESLECECVNWKRKHGFMGMKNTNGRRGWMSGPTSDAIWGSACGSPYPGDESRVRHKSSKFYPGTGSASFKFHWWVHM